MKRELKNLIGFVGTLRSLDNEMMNLDFYTSFNGDLKDYIECENVVFTAKRNLEEQYIISFDIIELNENEGLTIVKVNNVDTI